MASPISVKIEMPVYLTKYLIGQSENKQLPIEFPHGHDYNILLTRLISRDAQIKPPDYHQPLVEIKLPFNSLKDVYIYNKISRDDRILFREQVRRDLYYDLRLFLKDMIICGEERKIAIETFFFYYKITDDDVNIQSFYRSFTRYNEKKRAMYSLSDEKKFSHFNRKNVHRFINIANG